MIIAVSHLDHDRFAALHELQELEMRITMSGDDAVAFLSRQRTHAQVTGPECERATRSALQDDQFDVTAFRRQQRNRV